MKLARKSIVMFCAMAALLALPTSKALALSDDEAAVLVGIAVGGLAAYSVKHHREHDRQDWKYGNQAHGYSHNRSHNYHHKKRCHQNRSTRVEHYVVHNPPTRVYRNHRVKYRTSNYDSRPRGHYRSHKHYDKHYGF